MTTNLTTDLTPTGTASAVEAADPGWLALSAALTDEVPPIADREDLLVTISPGAGRGAPACFLPALATIEVDGTHLGVDPASAAPHRVGDRTRYGTAWGLLVHECAHARHTAWEPPEGAPPGAMAAATMLEESRIEAAQIRRRPDDRHWLRASTIQLVLNDTGLASPAITAPTASTGPGGVMAPLAGTGPADPGPSAPGPTAPGGASAVGAGMTAGDAARAAALVLGRVDAGILTDAEAEPLRTAVQAVLGADRVDRLRDLWRTAHTVDDDDAATMLELGRRWCEIVGDDPAVPAAQPYCTSDITSGRTSAPPTPGTGAGATVGAPMPPAAHAAPPGAPSGPGTDPNPGTGETALAGAIRETCERVKIMVSTETPPIDPAERAAAQRAAEDAARDGATRAARGVFGGRGVLRTAGGNYGRTATSGPRPATDTERTAARGLARALSTAGGRDRTATRTTSAMPPGRLRMRGALAVDAQRAAGALPTAEPFTRTTRRRVPTPPLRLGIACDVSGSMHRFAGPVASAAWILAHAAHHAQVPATTATVIFGRHVRAITRPGTAPVEITEFAAADNYEAIDVAIDALDGALDLSRPGAARLLVIVSDGQFRVDPRRAAQTRLDRLRAAGCGVLWLAPTDGHIAPLDGATVHPLTDPAATARAIGRAATTALRAT